jgi:uncharacterized SAM-binding protein YcdF (DUF218 family)
VSELGSFKSLATSLFLPPVSLLLLIFSGLLLATRRKPGGITLATAAVLLLWLLSCHGSAVWLARTVLPQLTPTSATQLKAARVQAIVVLGGGVLPLAPEYGQEQLSAESSARLRYAVWLSRQADAARPLPLAFSGGLGWTANSQQKQSEAEVASRSALSDYGATLRWAESGSRDTAANARLMTPILQAAGITHIALVTNAWHMPRSVAAFERAGLLVTPAPMGFTLPVRNGLMEWLPSGAGLQASQQVLREWLALLVGRFMPL